MTTKFRRQTETQIRNRVLKLAKVLDKKMPGWHKKVKIKIFDIEHANHCVLGQLFQGNIDGGLEQLGLSKKEDSWNYDVWEKYGIACCEATRAAPDEIFSEEVDREWGLLQKFWLEQIRARKAVKAVVAAA